MPEKVTADAGYFSAAALSNEEVSSVDLYVTPDSGKKTEVETELSAALAPAAEQPVIEAMREKLKTEAGRAVYKQRKLIVEPVFGQVKEVRGFRRFSFRGLRKNQAEWALICLTHNLLKLFRQGNLPASSSNINKMGKMGLSFAQTFATYFQVLPGWIQGVIKIDLELILTDRFSANALFIRSAT